ncbi:unnamed protein product, partial [Amoebophrya sp. A120]
TIFGERQDPQHRRKKSTAVPSKASRNFNFRYQRSNEQVLLQHTKDYDPVRLVDSDVHSCPVP